MSKLKVWIARFGDKETVGLREAVICFREPQRLSDGEFTFSNWEYLPNGSYPHIKNGTCYEAEISLIKEVK